MSGFKEINNLGIEISNQYALYEKIREQSSLENADQVGKKTQLDVVKPLTNDHYSLLFNLKTRNIPFGETDFPPRFFQSQNRAFTYNLLPSIGNQDQIESLISNLEAQEPLLKEENVLDELNQLKQFIRLLYNLEKDFARVENERSRLQKG